ncbi:MAG: ATP-binding cassette domain-containing protein [Labedaea sp.]
MTARDFDEGSGMPAVLVEGLRKSFGGKKALDDLNLRVEQGTVLGLLGPNGAGKTTTVRVLTTLLVPDSGRAEVAGFDVVRRPQQVRERIGLTGQYAAVDQLQTGYENLVMVGRLSRLTRRAAKRRAEELLASFDLAEVAGRLVRGYSGGMRRRLDLAASLMVAPPILILDEPTTGLDPRSRLDLWRTIADLVADGVTVLLTTQYLEEADHLADRIVVVDRGAVIAEGTPAELKARVGQAELLIDLSDESTVDKACTALRRVLAGEIGVTDGTRLQAPAAGVDTLTDALLALRENGIGVLDASIRRPSLDEAFLRLTGSDQVSRSDRAEAA